MQSDILDVKHHKYVVCFLLGNYPASGVYILTFRNTLFHLHRQVDVSRMKLGMRNGTGKFIFGDVRF